MDDSKVILFGSFTKDELNSLPKKLPQSPKVTEKKEFQFGSLTFVSGSSSDPINAESSLVPVAGSEVKLAAVVKKDGAMKSSTTSNQLLPGTNKVAKENGSINGLSFMSNVDKEAKEDSLPIVSLHISQQENSPSKDDTFKFEGVNGILAEKDVQFDVEKSNLTTTPRLVTPVNLIKKASNGAIDSSAILPRGLVNSGNLCFLNATLQALLACSPFVRFLQNLAADSISEASCPTLKAFVDFISEFEVPTGSSPLKKDAAIIETGRPLSPAMFEVVLKNFTPDVPSGISGRPRQEDAQEFLSFVMDEMHNELLKLQGHSSSLGGAKSSLISSSEDEEWETVGRKNKSAVTRTQSVVPSELSAIFGGQLRSVVRARGNKDSATVQPYLLLHLNIFPESVHTIEDALRLFPAPEPLEGYRASANGKGVVSASKSTKIQSLSKILILHLMRFSYGSRGSTKLHKTVHFPAEFNLASQLLVSPANESRKYELVATITHHGRDPSKGHYTADVRYPNGRWLRFDDSSVTSVPASKVLQEQVYVLFYQQV